MIEDTYEEEFYDENGRLSKNGIYDAGGNIIPGRWADFVDYLNTFCGE